MLFQTSFVKWEIRWIYFYFTTCDHAWIEIKLLTQPSVKIITTNESNLNAYIE